MRRPRPTQTKSKKEDLFGFDDTDFNLEENSADSGDGKPSYKIQYFGFDDMSDSDGADDDSESKPRRKVAQAAASKATPAITVKEMTTATTVDDDDDVPDPFERLENRESQQIWEKPPVKESKNSERKTQRGTRTFQRKCMTRH